MLLRRAARSVVQRCCAATTTSEVTKQARKLKCSCPVMLQAVDDHGLVKPPGVRCFSTMEDCKGPNLRNHSIIINVPEEYEEAIKTLNTLQSNAESIRRSIEVYANSKPLIDMEKYLLRTGLSLEQLEQQSFIHVSGTKGKGTACALTESILRSHGIKTGFFSSPHLVSVTERIRINGTPISKKKFVSKFWSVYRSLKAAQEHEGDMPAYFKFLTILCFHIFLEEKVDVMILEVGIGGEMDCTNIIRNTKTVGITSLGLEHTQLLGNTLEEIAWQKAGIIKRHSNVYTSVTQPECLKVIRERAAEKNATVHIVPDLRCYMNDVKTETILNNLNNVNQINGSLAIQLAYDWLRSHDDKYKQCYELNSHRLSRPVLEGLVNCNWPGRCQVVKVLNFNMHFDGAHTVESMWICSEWFKKVSEKSGNPKILIFNTTGDRDSKKFLDILRHNNQFEQACFVTNIASGSAKNSDTMSIYGITDQIKRTKFHAGNWHLLCLDADEPDSSYIFGSILDAFKHIHNYYKDDRQLDILVTGSLHLIGATMLALNEFRQRLEQK